MNTRRTRSSPASSQKSPDKKPVSTDKSSRGSKAKTNGRKKKVTKNQGDYDVHTQQLSKKTYHLHKDIFKDVQTYISDESNKDELWEDFIEANLPDDFIGANLPDNVITKNQLCTIWDYIDNGMSEEALVRLWEMNDQSQITPLQIQCLDKFRRDESTKNRADALIPTTLANIQQEREETGETQNQAEYDLHTHYMSFPVVVRTVKRLKDRMKVVDVIDLIEKELGERCGLKKGTTRMYLFSYRGTNDASKFRTCTHLLALGNRVLESPHLVLANLGILDARYIYPTQRFDELCHRFAKEEANERITSCISNALALAKSDSSFDLQALIDILQALVEMPTHGEFEEKQQLDVVEMAKLVKPNRRGKKGYWVDVSLRDICIAADKGVEAIPANLPAEKKADLLEAVATGDVSGIPDKRVKQLVIFHCGLRQCPFETLLAFEKCSNVESVDDLKAEADTIWAASLDGDDDAKGVLENLVRTACHIFGDEPIDFVMAEEMDEKEVKNERLIKDGDVVKDKDGTIQGKIRTHAGDNTAKFRKVCKEALEFFETRLAKNVTEDAAFNSRNDGVEEEPVQVGGETVGDVNRATVDGDNDANAVVPPVSNAQVDDDQDDTAQFADFDDEQDDASYQGDPTQEVGKENIVSVTDTHRSRSRMPLTAITNENSSDTGKNQQKSSAVKEKAPAKQQKDTRSIEATQRASDAEPIIGTSKKMPNTPNSAPVEKASTTNLAAKEMPAKDDPNGTLEKINAAAPTASAQDTSTANDGAVDNEKGSATRPASFQDQPTTKVDEEGKTEGHKGELASSPKNYRPFFDNEHGREPLSRPNSSMNNPSKAGHNDAANEGPKTDNLYNSETTTVQYYKPTRVRGRITVRGPVGPRLPITAHATEVLISRHSTLFVLVTVGPDIFDIVTCELSYEGLLKERGKWSNSPIEDGPDHSFNTIRMPRDGKLRVLVNPSPGEPPICFIRTAEKLIQNFAVNNN